MNFFRQFKILCWKNSLLKRRMYFQTFLEILFPVIVMLAFVGIRNAVSVEEKPFQTHTSAAVSFDTSPFTDGFDLYKVNVKYLIQSGAYVGKIAIVGQPGPDMDKLIYQWGIYNAPYTFKYERESTSEYFTNATYTLANFTVTNLKSDSELVSYVTSSSYGVGSNPQLVAAIVIEQFGNAANNFQWNYKLRGNASRNDRYQTSFFTSEIEDVNQLQWIWESTNWPVLAKQSHVFLQLFVDSFIIQQSIPSSNPVSANLPKRNIELAPFFTPPFRLDQFADFVGDSIGLIFTVAFLWPITRIAKLLVEEKESRIKEGMKMMGLSESALFLSWQFAYAIIFFIMSIIIVLATGSSIFKYSDKGRIFIFFWFFGLATFSYAYLLSTVFSKARTASTMAAITYLVLYFPYYAIAGDRASSGTKTAACLSAPTCFGLGAYTIIKYEAAGTGVTNSNAGTEINGFSYNQTIGMLFFDIIFYIILALYFNEVLPTEWGTQRPWYFLVTKSFWCPERVNSNSSKARLTSYDHSNPEQRSAIEMAENPNISPLEGDHIEPVSEEFANRPGVKVRHLRKEYGSKLDGVPLKVAVKDFSLDFYEGEITCLLGHNGAGTIFI